MRAAGAAGGLRNSGGRATGSGTTTDVGARAAGVGSAASTRTGAAGAAVFSTALACAIRIWAALACSTLDCSALTTCRAISRTAGDGSATATWKAECGGASLPKAVAVPEPRAGLGSSIQAMLGFGARLRAVCRTAAAGGSAGPGAAAVTRA
ncbi:hypothetical protein ACRAWG_29010 [Methylobacterium sp. P31]